jgi:hypothetical protein
MAPQRGATVLAGRGTPHWLVHALAGIALTFVVGLGAAVAATTAPPLAVFLMFLALLCAAYPAAALAGARQRSQLRLSEEGFTIGPFDHFIPWAAIERFEVMERGAARLVAFDAASGSDLASLRWVRRIAGHDGALTESYGKDPYELAALLEAWRRAALRRAHGYNS